MPVSGCRMSRRFSDRVAVHIAKANETVDVVSDLGFRCYRSVGWFKKYVREQVLAQESMEIEEVVS